MEFSEKLTILMDIYRIKNAKLAKGIKVDPSLISRWKTGQRLPAKNSGAEIAIAAFLAAQKILPVDRGALAATLGAPCGDFDSINSAVLKWLLDPEADIAETVYTAPDIRDGEDLSGGATGIRDDEDLSGSVTDICDDEDLSGSATDIRDDDNLSGSVTDIRDDEDLSGSVTDAPDKFDYFDSDDLDLDDEENGKDSGISAGFDAAPDVEMPTKTLDVLHKLLLNPPRTIENRPVNLWPRVLKGQPFEHELFKGAAGKRQAAINFLHSVLSHNKIVDIYMMSQENNSWIDDDPIFADLWSNALLAIARNGHKLNIIHTTNADADELPFIIKGFMQLYASGRLSSYYRKNYVHDLGLPTIFVAKGLCAAVSYCCAGLKNSEYTVLYRNNWDTIIYENLFNTYLEDSRLLVSACARRGMRAYAEQIVIFEHAFGDRTLLKNSLSGLWMTEQILYKHMSRQLSPDDSSFFLDLFARRRENFENMVQSHKWIEIISKNVLDKIALNGTCLFPGHELFCPDDVTLDAADLKAYITQLLELLMRFDNFEIVFIDNIPIDINMMLRHGQSACFTAASEPESPSAVIIGEEIFLKSMGKYFSTVLPKYNKKESRDKTMSELENILRSLT